MGIVTQQALSLLMVYVTRVHLSALNIFDMLRYQGFVFS